MPEPRFSDDARRRINDLMWDVALRQARERFPDYRFYRQVPSEYLGVEEAPDPEQPSLRGVHLSYLDWPQRETFSHQTAPLSPEQVLARVKLTLECVEKEPEDLAGETTQWRHVTLTGPDGRSVTDAWDLAVGDEHPFDEPWPPSAAQVLESMARDAAQVDDGRSAEEWLEALPDPKAREHWREVQQMRVERDAIGEHVRYQRQEAWRLYRLLGAELYEGLVAGYRVPLASALYQNADPDQRASAQRQRAKRLGGRLRAARTEAGLSVEQACELTGLATARVVGGERGQATLKVSDLLALASLYRADPAELLAEPEPAPNEGSADVSRPPGDPR
jgi:hypothetical protein